MISQLDSGLTCLEQVEQFELLAVVGAGGIAEPGPDSPMPFVDELSGSVDALLREMTIVEKSRMWAAE